VAIKLEGNWKNGLAFDVHTLSSTYLGVNEYGYNQWESTRCEIGELLYQLKYRADARKVLKIIKLLDNPLVGHLRGGVKSWAGVTCGKRAPTASVRSIFLPPRDVGDPPTACAGRRH